MAEAVIDILIRARDQSASVVRQLNTSLRTIRESLSNIDGIRLNSLENDLEQAGRESEDLSDSVREALRSVRELSQADIGNLEEQLKEAGDAAQRTGRNLQDIGRSLQSTGSELRGAAGEIAAFSAGVGAGPALAIREFAQLEDAIAQVNAIATQAPATAGGAPIVGFSATELAEVTESIENLGRTTAFTATQVAGGFRFLTQAGLSTNESLRAIGPSLALASAGQLSLAEAADIATNAQSALRLSVQEIPRVVDTLAIVASSANTNVSQLGQALTRVAPAAAALGIEVEEVTGVLGALAQGGFRGSEAGTNLRRILTRLSAPTDRAAAALQRLGVQTRDANGDFRGLNVILSDLNAANIGFEDSVEIFDQYAASASLAAINLSDFSVQLTETAENAEGFAQSVAEARLDSLVGDVTKLGSAFSGLLAELGGNLAPTLRSIVQGITEVINNVTQWARQNEFLASTLIGVPALLAVIGAGVAAVIGVVGILIGGIGSFITSLSLLTPVVAAVSAAFVTFSGAITAANVALARFFAGGLLATLGRGLAALSVALRGFTFTALVSGLVSLAGGVGTATAAVKLFTLALLANPIGLIIRGIVLAFTALSAAIIFFEDEIIAAAQALGFFNANSDIPGVVRTKEQIEEFAQASKDAREEFESLRGVLGEQVQGGFDRQLAVLNAALFEGGERAKTALKEFRSFAQQTRVVSAALEQQQQQLQSFRQQQEAQRLQERRQVIQDEIDAEKEGTRATEQTIQRLTRAIEGAAQERKRITERGATDRAAIEQRGASALLDIEGRLRENRRAGFSEQRQQADVVREANSRLSRAFLALQRAEQETNQERRDAALAAAQADIQRASSLAGQVQSQSQQRNLLNELARITQRSTQTEIALSKQAEAAQLAKVEAEKAANEEARKVEEERLRRSTAIIQGLTEAKERLGDPVTLSVDVQVAKAEERLAALQQQLRELQQTDITLRINARQGAQDGGVITPGLQSGGLVRRLGFNRGGLVPTLLEDGEFKIPPGTARKFMPMLHAINSGGRSDVRALQGVMANTPSRLGSVSGAGKLPGYGGGDRRAHDLPAGTFIVNKQRTREFLPLLRSMTAPGASPGTLASMDTVKMQMGGLLGRNEMQVMKLQDGGEVIQELTTQNPASIAPTSVAESARVTERVALDLTINEGRTLRLESDRREDIDELVATLSDFQKTLAGGHA